MKFNKNKTPLSNKLIKLYGDDCFGDYTIQGMFIDYKKPIKRGSRIIKSRFCKLVDNQYMSDISEWKNGNNWEYVE